MICPNCGHDNLPGSEECSRCLQDLTQLDLPTAQNQVERSLMEDSVRTLHPRAPVTVSPSTPIREAVQLMQNSNIGAVLVVDEQGKLVGIFSERDLLMKVALEYNTSATSQVRDHMTPNPESVTVEDRLAFVVHKMDVGGYRHLPVLADGKPLAVISARDLLHHITRLCRDL